MQIFKYVRALGAAAMLLTVGLAALGGAAASAAPATTQTVHVKALQNWGTPLAPVTNNGCPTWAVNDNVFQNLTGNGVQHYTQNGAGDFWFTSTFEGNGTIAFYPGAAIYDKDGNIIGAAGSAEQTVTGHLVTWFGDEGNRQSAVAHGTATFQGIVNGSGTSITLHFHQQAVWTPGMDPNGPPKLLISITNC